MRAGEKDPQLPVEGQVELLWATDDLKISNRSFKGFPLLRDRLRQPIEPAQSFLWKELTEGSSKGVDTWRKYGRAMYDFEGFVAARGLDWRARSQPGYPAAIYSYRAWAKGDCQLGAEELNRRLRILLRYYEWSVEEGHLDRIPFDTNAVFREDEPSQLVEHATAAGSRLAVEGWNGRLSFLIEEHNQRCISELSNETHRLQYRMMRETGLRQCECRTFPHALIVDPKTLSIPRNQYIESPRLSWRPVGLSQAAIAVA